MVLASCSARYAVEEPASTVMYSGSRLRATGPASGWPTGWSTSGPKTRTPFGRASSSKSAKRAVRTSS